MNINDQLFVMPKFQPMTDLPTPVVNYESKYRKALSMGQLAFQLMHRTIKQRNSFMKVVADLTEKLEPFIVYQCREIGEGDFVTCSKERFIYCQKSPEHDTTWSVVNLDNQKAELTAQIELLQAAINKNCVSPDGEVVPDWVAELDLSKTNALRVVEGKAVRAAVKYCNQHLAFLGGCSGGAAQEVVTVGELINYAELLELEA